MKLEIFLILLTSLMNSTLAHGMAVLPKDGIFTQSDGLRLGIVTTFGLDNKFEKRESEASCPPVNNHSGALGEARNQGSANWCYGFVAADMIGHKVGKRLSAAHASINYAYSWAAKDRSKHLLYPHQLNGGRIDMAIAESLTRGICEESSLPYANSSMLIVDDYLMNLSQITKALENIGQHSLNDEEKIDAFDCLAENFTKKLFPQLTREDAVEILVKSIPNTKKIERFYERACKDKVNVPWKKYQVSSLDLFRKSKDGKEFEEYVPDQGHHFFPKIDRALEQKDIVGISVNSSKIFGQTGNHAMSIIGRRFENGNCNYIVRNSWGKDCGSASRRYKCENGNIIVPEEVLKASLIGVTVLDDLPHSMY